MDDRDRGFAEYFAARSGAMRGTAFLLCGDWHRAEDLVQTSFVKLYRVWNRISEHGKLDAYTRQILVRTFLDETRRGFFRREQVTDEPGDWAAPAQGSPEDRMVLLRALARVPARQRAALVLRYWEDLSLEETARALKCSTGTVKSQASRGLVNLRALLPATTAAL
ncbi:SigE family RNA polymerase sigma factor [Actinokineospora sp. NBRC 105648]|uniref:SigE family RNA polymerase sigma factor n=1 Tax=Actinokineospora sp. NBRC 105648 TaxID=3032206 RepID=UPI0024A461CF|nr:SigE family RNA polymerase sigma factor [Actinokineospora sp. NBRC 105648]GLZ38304.1 RNA polymerase sigma24 factor [Actinokineospora sp. NBRC 105648]